jgi:glycosyltransferase involved in cell wall biosynthesis
MEIKSEKIRVAIVISHPVQHFVHLYKALAKREDIHLKVFFASKIGIKSYFDKDMDTEIKWASDLLSGYGYMFLPEADGIHETGFIKINNPSINRELKKFNPHVVQLHGYAQMTLLRALLWCKFKHIPVLLWSDSSLLFKRTYWKQVFKNLVLPKLLSLFDGVLSTGDNNAAYYLRYGIKSEQIFRCPFTIDEDLLEQARSEKFIYRQKLRFRYGMENDEFVLLFVGKLAPWKRPKDILDSLSLAQKKLGSKIKLVAFFAGNGVLLESLKTQAESENLRAIFAGFVNVDILPSVYAMADVLIFPSEREPYGLSAREAICLGLPLILSDQIGCIGATDAARLGENALIYQSKNISELAQSIITLAENPEKVKKMSDSSLTIAREMHVEKSVSGFILAVQSTCKQSKLFNTNENKYERN